MRPVLSQPRFPVSPKAIWGRKAPYWHVENIPLPCSELRKSENTLKQMLENVSCKGSERKYFGHCRPCSLSHLLNTGHGGKEAINNIQVRVHCCIPLKLYLDH